jgi:hypothetical protein
MHLLAHLSLDDGDSGSLGSISKDSIRGSWLTHIKVTITFATMYLNASPTCRLSNLFGANACQQSKE